MKVRILEERLALARAAAVHAAELIRRAIAARGRARILAAGAPSHVEFLEALAQEPDVAWGEVELFHLDELVGVGVEHPGSRRRTIFERFISRTRPGRYHLLDGLHEPERVCRDEGEQLRAAPVDVAFAGIGENGQLSFNEPPADFATERPYLIVRLDESRRRQHVARGEFASLAEVPDRAIAISIRQLLKASAIVCVVPEARKAAAVRRCLCGPVSPLAPASVLQTHPEVTVYLDRESAALLDGMNGASA